MIYLSDTATLGGCVLTLGNFDGIHLGHRSLIAKTLELSGALSLPSVIWTFKEHPQNLLAGKSIKYVLCAEEKARIIEDSGIDFYYEADFAAFRNLPPLDFIKNELLGRFKVRRAVCGWNFSFGSGGDGSAAQLERLLSENDAGCTVLPPVMSDGKPISSTRLRALITGGDMEGAAKLLGRLYSFKLPVCEGRKMGRRLGSPTINQLFPLDRATPAYGVYAVYCEAQGRLYKGVANIGVRPTVGQNADAPVCETHIFNFSGDLYNQEVKVLLYKKLRDEKKFAGMDELSEQITKDCEAAKTALNSNSVTSGQF